MFFANGYVETDRRASAVNSDENDILRELLLDGEFVSPRQLSYGEACSITASASMSGLSKRSDNQVDVSFPQICFDNSPNFTRLQPLSNRSCTSFSLSNQSPLSASVVNSIVSPPRVFVQEFAPLPQSFTQDDYLLDSEMRNIKSERATVSFLTSCLPPAPLPMLSMPPHKKKRLSSTNSLNSERKQLRCKFPDCPNLRRSAGFCNRHSGKVCSILGCNKSALSRGKCPEHGGGSRCKREGCSKFAQTRGLCKSHGGGRQCNVSGCIKNAHQNRLCRSHGGGKRCDYFGCPKWAQRSGYCCAHTKMSSTDDSGVDGVSHANISATVASSPASSICMVSAPVLSPTLLSPHRLFSLP
ncbi:uncharacterized protein PHALS_07325 [Plasmopara halstedii]|uniref:WRKY19-like zinc finger domain-containing protein n=1 Tax=Plasmopara halstedii TaxID=4781 RepID=A0A0P1B460_PLAHL|nr:uncharacterized protein PHALS_07325 [Plasmopara halstedii]CEG49567.1 hypothetical protein PHALS_07325 [Plasmopara halstedii]|eukprot:XP_024585936.1 hypothetical protein PHALS_07325 [Plasmopara halstedii]